MALLRRSTDKNGRLIADAFLDLPERDLYPDYYETIPMPLSIEMIEDKLSRGQYTVMTDIESDLKRMVQNAKDYNSSKSEIFEDAERIRKALSNFMPKHNPAYQDPEYRAVPTPIPDHVIRVKLRDSSASGSEQPPIKLRLNAPTTRRRSEIPTEIINESVDASPVDDLTEVQIELLDELSTQEHAINFEHKPSRRDIPEYYRIIKKPTSINDVRKMVQSGKVRTWDDFAQETRLIWSNAKEFNEPGSEIYVMTEALEAWLEERLQAHGIPAKVVPKLSLKTQAQPRQLKLKVGTPLAPAVNGTVDTYTVDKAALERQRVEMSSALNRAHRDPSQPGSTPVPIIPSSLRRSVSVADVKDVAMTGTGLNGITSVVTTNPLKAIIPPAGPSHLPTPTLEGEPPRQGQGQLQPLKPSPFSSQPQTNLQPLTNGYHHPQAVPPPFHQNTSTSMYSSTSSNPIDRKFRLPGKSASDALLSSVTYMTNPSIPNDPRWRITRHASDTNTQTSYYTYLPASYARIRVAPELHTDLRAGKRKHKLFVVSNGAVLPASPSVEGGGVYDLTLGYGENVVVVEVVAELPAMELGQGKEADRFEFERMTFYIYLRQ